jgi:hypothetical protein
MTWLVKMLHTDLILVFVNGLVLTSAAPFDNKLPTASCTAFAQIDLSDYNATFTAAQRWPTGSKNITNVFNSYAFCEVNATVRYTSNDTLEFSLWLPEVAEYGGSFTAVGKCIWQDPRED